ncbi:hypothetical protein M569_09741, partial [Genlisea aurea]
QQQQQQDDYAEVLREISALVFNSLMRSRPPPAPPSIGFDGRRTASGPSSFENMTPAGFASLLLGVSLSLMLCGSVIFFLGFVLMPWVVGLVVFMYFVGLISSISMIGKALL